MADSFPRRRRSVFSKTRAAAAGVAAFALAAGVGAGASHAEAPADASSLDLILPVDGEPGLAAVRMRLTRDGKPWSVDFRQAVDRLFDFLDRDADGALSEAEAARLPLPFEVRRLLWGASFPPAGAADGKPADLDRDGKIARDELWTFYDRRSVGLTAASGRAPLSERLTARLVERLDVDRDGKVSAAELDGGWKSLAGLDLNEDELVSPSELTAGSLYPGTLGGTLLPLLPYTATKSVALDPVDLQAKLSRLVDAQLESDAMRSSAYAKLAAVPPAVEWDAALPSPPPSGGAPAAAPSAPRRAKVGPLRLLMWTDVGGAPAAVALATRSFRDQFREADHDRDGRIAAAEIQKNELAPLRNLVAFADRDADGKLSQAELDAYLDLSAALARGQTLVTVLDFGQGLFESLDDDASGALSAAELASARDRLTADGCFAEGVLHTDRLPRTIRIAAACGHPRSAFAPRAAQGPAWFVGMDRNGDGSVSRQEFLGGDAPFARLDRDRDGALSAEEAAAAEAIAAERTDGTKPTAEPAPK